mgnify:CR=1 FL=1
MWIFTGAFSILLTLTTWIFAFRKSRNKIWSAAAAIIFMVFTVLLWYHQIYRWILNGDWAALSDVIPPIFPVLCGYAVFIILLNCIPVFVGKNQDQGMHSVKR